MVLASVAVTVYAVPVPLSAKLAVVADVKTGLISSISVTVIVTSWLTELVPSLAITLIT